jgi:hypothetical protein
MMRPLSMSVVAAMMMAGSALAQTGQAPSDPLAVKPLSASTQDSDTDAIRSKLEKAGYSHVEGLSRDETGLWHAHARKGNDALDLVVDKGGRIKPALH